MGTASIYAGSPEGIGLKKHPQEEYSHQGRAALKFLRVCRGYGILSHVGKGQKVHLLPHLNLIMMTEGSYHAKVLLFHSISNQDVGGSGFTTDHQTSIGDKLHPSLAPNVRGPTWGKNFSNISLNQQVPMTGSSRVDVHSFSENNPRRDGSSTILLLHLAILGHDI